MKLSDKGLNLIKQFEGFESKPYKDSAGIPTIGYGFTYYPDGRKVTMSDGIITEPQAEIIFRQLFSMNYEKFIPSTVNQNQFDALGAFIYNVGVKAFKNSTLYKYIIADPNNSAIRQEFMKWDKITVNGRKVPLRGLTNRRKQEADLYFTPIETA